jgi:hypothetical protein
MKGIRARGKELGVSEEELGKIMDMFAVGLKRAGIWKEPKAEPAPAAAPSKETGFLGETRSPFGESWRTDPGHQEKSYKKTYGAPPRGEEKARLTPEERQGEIAQLEGEETSLQGRMDVLRAEKPTEKQQEEIIQITKRKQDVRGDLSRLRKEQQQHELLEGRRSELEAFKKKQLLATPERELSETGQKMVKEKPKKLTPMQKTLETQKALREGVGEAAPEEAALPGVAPAERARVEQELAEAGMPPVLPAEGEAGAPPASVEEAAEAESTSEEAAEAAALSEETETGSSKAGDIDKRIREFVSGQLSQGASATVSERDLVGSFEPEHVAGMMALLDKSGKGHV